MSENNSLLKKIHMYDFIVDEMILYLDTHPNCQNGLDYFRKYKDLRDKAYLEYSQKYGALTADQTATTDRWTWINSPWPWEREANV